MAFSADDARGFYSADAFYERMNTLAQSTPASPSQQAATAQSIATEAAVNSGLGGAVIGALGGLIFAKATNEENLGLWALGGAACFGVLCAAVAYEATLDFNSLIVGAATGTTPAPVTGS